MNKLPHASIIATALLTGLLMIVGDIVINISFGENYSWALFINETIIPLVCLSILAVIAEVLNKKAKLGMRQTFVTVFLSGLVFMKIFPTLAYTPLPMLFLGSVVLVILSFYVIIGLFTYFKIVSYK